MHYDSTDIPAGYDPAAATTTSRILGDGHGLGGRRTAGLFCMLLFGIAFNGQSSRLRADVKNLAEHIVVAIFAENDLAFRWRCPQFRG